MTFNGKIIEVRREAAARNNKDAIYTHGRVAVEGNSDFWLMGFEPEVTFVLGQKVTIIVGDV